MCVCICVFVLRVSDVHSHDDDGPGVVCCDCFDFWRAHSSASTLALSVTDPLRTYEWMCFFFVGGEQFAYAVIFFIYSVSRFCSAIINFNCRSIVWVRFRLYTISCVLYICIVAAAAASAALLFISLISSFGFLCWLCAAHNYICYLILMQNNGLAIHSSAIHLLWIRFFFSKMWIGAKLPC